jgi:hypothetical protein
MNQQHAVTPIIASHERQHEADTQLYGRWLILARLVWFALVAFTLSVYIASLPSYLTTLQTVCRQAFCAYGQLSPDIVAAFQRFGLSVGSYTAFMLSLTIVFALVSFGASGVIFWRKSDDWLALLCALDLVVVGTIPVIYMLVTSHFAWQLPIQGVFVLFWLLGGLVYSLFPNGRFVPSFTSWLFVGYSIESVVYTFFTNPFNGFFIVPLWLGVAVDLLFASLAVGLTIAQVYRYRYVSTLVQRQQTKWVVYMFTAFTVWVVPGFLLALIFPRSLFPLVYILGFNCVLFLYPLTLSFAILRYRLWEIDVLINRTLVYGSLTAVLVVFYIGLVIGLQSLVHLVTGTLSEQPLVIVASTLAIAALFQPLRRRIQAIIDHRFYRRKYDAAKIVEAFSSTLRNEVDLHQLREHLLTVVQDTMQPSHISLWLREPASQPPRLDRMPPT